MEISFDTMKLREVCADELVAAEEIGASAAEALRHRISDIRAADSIRDLLAGNPRVDEHHGAECYVIELSQSASLKVVPAHAQSRLKDDGAVDWDRVRRVKVVSLDIKFNL